MGTSAKMYICWVAYILDPGTLLVPRRSRKCASQPMVVFSGSAKVLSYLHDRADFVGLLDVQLQTHISLVVLSLMEEAGQGPTGLRPSLCQLALLNLVRQGHRLHTSPLVNMSRGSSTNFRSVVT
jgi:hypothetical protein